LASVFALDTAALSVTSSVVITPTPRPATMAGQAFAGHAFELDIDPAVAVTATIRYSAADIRVASDPGALALWRWTGAAWEPACAEPARDAAGRTLTARLCQPGAYALFAPSHQLILPFMAKE
ncbi:MAG TPA: hypothetical protein VD886_13710, partial [Herpetosiphonaceae bacterium]|nr:hypothetical protein [Herpetosiphonaceae bacterium]